MFKWTSNFCLFNKENTQPLNLQAISGEKLRKHDAINIGQTDIAFQHNIFVRIFPTSIKNCRFRVNFLSHEMNKCILMAQYHY